MAGGTHLRHASPRRPLEKKAAHQAFGHALLPAIATGACAASSNRIFPAEQVEAAFDYMAQPASSEVS